MSLELYTEKTLEERTGLKAGMQAVCVASNGYALTEGKEYTILDVVEGFWNTPYVRVNDDQGTPVHAYYHRFKEKQDNG